MINQVQKVSQIIRGNFVWITEWSREGEPPWGQEGSEASAVQCAKGPLISLERKRECDLHLEKDLPDGWGGSYGEDGGGGFYPMMQWDRISSSGMDRQTRL